MAHRTIVVKGTGVASEAVANATITPGMLVEVMTMLIVPVLWCWREERRLSC